MANITGYSETTDPSWIQIHFDDGSVMHAQDPTGTYRNEVSGIAQKFGYGTAPNSMANAVAGPGGGDYTASEGVGGDAGDIIGGGPPPAPATGAPAYIAGANVGIGATPPAVSPSAPAPNPSVPVAAAPPTPTPTQSSPSGPFMMPGSPGVSRSTWSTSGIDPKALPGIKAGYAAATNAQDAAIASQKEANDAAGTAREDQLNQAYADRYTTVLQKKAETDAQANLLKAKTAAHDQEITRLNTIAARPIDPGAAFRGDDGGLYAFMSSIGAGIQNFGAALMGRGPVADPVAGINAIIERSVRMQTEQRQKEFDAGKITADDLQADMNEARARLYVLGSQMAEAQRAVSDTKQELLGVDALKKQMDAGVQTSIANAAMNKANIAVNLAPKTTSGGEVTKAVGPHAGTPKELLDLGKTASEIYKNDPATLSKVLQALGLPHSDAAASSQPKSPLTNSQTEDLQGKLDGIAGTANKMKEIGKIINVKTDGNGHIVSASPADDIFPVVNTARDMADGIGHVPWIGGFGKSLVTLIDAGNATANNTVRNLSNDLALQKTKAETGRVAGFDYDVVSKQLPMVSTDQYVAGLQQYQKNLRQDIQNARAAAGDDYVREQLRLRGIDMDDVFKGL